MRIALRQEVSSPESRFLTQILTKFGEVDVLDPWNTRNVTETYDLAVGVGAVTSCPQAKRKILFVLGPTARHKKFGWDDIVVTSKAAVVNSLKAFGYDSKIHLHPVPLLEMQAGRRRIMKYLGSVDGNATDENPGSFSTKICLGAYFEEPATIDLDIDMILWALPNNYYNQVPFSAMEFNSACLNGAVGVYPDTLIDGYDIQVRKHLALGSFAFCPKDRDVIGDLADVVKKYHFHMGGIGVLMESDKQEVIEDKVLESDYIAAVEEIIRRN